jgi:hypothetical protein
MDTIDVYEVLVNQHEAMLYAYFWGDNAGLADDTNRAGRIGRPGAFSRTEWTQQAIGLSSLLMKPLAGPAPNPREKYCHLTRHSP